MIGVVSNCWALFLGMGLIMLGNGLQGTLLGLRASIEGFGTTSTGLVMSGYFIGLIIGCLIVPKMVSRVGHIRIFGALASLASTAILVQAIFIDPWTWGLMRIITGFSYAGLYIVAESWLNEFSDNKSRGKLLSLYMLVSLGGMAGGQLLLNIAAPTGMELFILVSIMVSLAVIPILVSATKAPKFEATENISILQLYRVSPLGVFGMFITGITMGSVFGMGAVYATYIDMSVQEVSFFMGSLIVGGFIFQYPLGWLSDLIGRRVIIIACCIGGAIISGFAMNFDGNIIMVYVVAATVGGMVMPLYSLCGAHTNDYLTPTQMVAASGTLVLVNAAGATVGAPLTAFAMAKFGPEAFYGLIALMLVTVAVFALWRMTRRSAINAEDRGDFVVMATTPFSASLTPDVKMVEITAAAKADTEEVVNSFDELLEELASPEWGENKENGGPDKT